MLNKNIICFRVDASLEMGTGHVMRCLTLADALAADGAECHFICREHPGNLFDTIKIKGHHIHRLPMSSASNNEDSSGLILAHAHWLGSDWRTDAYQTCEYLGALRPDWLVVDHYSLDQRWEQKVRSVCSYLMVIDDLADRDHVCDLLLDQTLNRQPQVYQTRVPEHCKILTGAGFMLLRPEFSKLRNYSLERRQSGALKNILINLGGADKDNLTEKVLSSFKTIPLPADTKIVVVVGGTFPWRRQVSLLAESLAYQVDVFSNVTNMAELMSDCDLAIGAAGSTSWERCCLGLPTLMLVVADNQLEVAKSLEQSNAVMRLQNLNEISIELEECFLKLHNQGSSLLDLSQSARNVTSGSGIQGVKDAMLSVASINDCRVSLREATKLDCDLVFEWQVQSEMRKFFRDPKAPAYKDHCRWFLKNLEDERRCQLVIMSNGDSAGVLRLDERDAVNAVFEVSIFLAKRYQGLGVAKSALELLRLQWPNRTLIAFVKEENISSKTLFESSGYVFDGIRYISRP